MDDYTVCHVIGQGYSGIVKLCIRKFDKRKVVLKIITPSDRQTVSLSQHTRFGRTSVDNEIGVLKKLDHINVIKYFDSFQHEESNVIVMEYAEGGSLSAFLKQRDGQYLSEFEILDFITQLVLGLQYIHEMNILHRDVKCENIFLHRNRRLVKIGDFGVSKECSHANTFLGTLNTISPEIWRNETYGNKSDIWSLGCVCYELCALQPAFQGSMSTLLDSVNSVSHSPLPPRYSDSLHSLIGSMLNITARDRPSAAEILCHPVILPHMFRLYCDVGMVICEESRAASIWYWTCTSNGSEGSVETKPLTFGSVISAVDCINVICISACKTRCLAVAASGTMFMWSVRELDSAPYVLDRPTTCRIAQACCNEATVLCVTPEGDVLSCGSAVNACLGREAGEAGTSRLQPIRSLASHQVTMIDCGTTHVCVVTIENAVFTWGSALNGKTGHPTTVSRAGVVLSPTQVVLPYEATIMSVVCGANCTLLCTVDGDVLVCGNNTYGKLGLTPSVAVTTFTSLRQQLGTGFPGAIKQMAVGVNHVAYISFGDELYTAGSNASGQLGRPITQRCMVVHENARNPISVPFCSKIAPISTPFLRQPITDVVCGSTWTCCLASDGSVVQFGGTTPPVRHIIDHREDRNDIAALVDPVVKCIDLPTSAKCCRMAAGYDRCFFVTSSGTT